MLQRLRLLLLRHKVSLAIEKLFLKRFHLFAIVSKRPETYLCTLAELFGNLTLLFFASELVQLKRIISHVQHYVAYFWRLQASTTTVYEPLLLDMIPFAFLLNTAIFKIMQIHNN